MFKKAYRMAAASLLAAFFVSISTLPGRPDSSEAFNTLVLGANAGLKAALNAKIPPGTVAQAPPVQQSPVGGSSQLGLPIGFTYTADLSAAYPYGNIGTTGKNWLPGGEDFVVGYGFSPTDRFVANYYELQHYPVGFNSGTVPLYLQGFASPIAAVNLASSQPQINVTTKDRFLLLMYEKLFTLGKMKGRPIPVVVTPTYVSRWSSVAASSNGTDIVAFEPNAPNGFPVTGINTRTAQVWSLALTFPFLKTSKMFGTFTVAPSVLGHEAGLNQTNNVQLYQVGYLEYTPREGTTIFFEPQSSRDYLPTDPYPQHLVAYFLGVSQRFAKYGFVQLVLNSGGPTNYSPYGVSALTCQALPCSANPVVPTVGGLKATQIQLQFGIGSPSVIQF